MLTLHRKVPRVFNYESELIKVTKEDFVATVMIDNPPLNMNDLHSMNDLLRIFRLLPYDPEVRTIILTGAGTRAFNVGSDISYLPSLSGDFRGGKCNLEADLMATIEECPKAVICAIEGYCLGGGLEMALCCDFRVASEKSKFGVPEINIGVIPASGGMYRLPKCIGVSRAIDMMYTGRHITAQEAFDWGLVARLYEPGTVLENAKILAKELAGKPPKSIRTIKRFVAQNAFKPNEECFRPNLDYIDDIFEDYNFMEGIKAFMEKRAPEFNYDDEEHFDEE